jgi:hypothetical protein
MIARNVFFLCLFLLSGAVAGCARPAPTGGENPEKAGGSASGAAGESPTAGGTVSGTVVETMNASSYTYVRVDTGDGEIWAAANRFEVAVGDRVTVPLEMPMEGFHSDALDRDFDRIYFASAILPEDAAAGQGMPASHGAPVARPLGPDSAVAPAEGGVTVAEVWNRRSALAGSTVTVRGRVVKVNAQIMGRNWLHIQDGSGDEGLGTHDLTVTSADSAPVGSVVTVTGTVAVDQDFGFGYSYDVMVTDASLIRESPTTTGRGE